eukprot:405963_1
MAQEPLDEIKIDRNNREYDLVIYGATGFTGAIVAKEFISRYATSNINFKFAIAGRNNTKLTKLRNELQTEYKLQINNLSKIVPLSNTPQFLELNDKTRELNICKQEYISNLPIIISDVSNISSLKSMIESTKLIISCIGPYRLLGEKVIELCSLSGTHYVDICGEPEFMERCAYKYYKQAENTGALIVNACGFDSIPSDMGCLFIDQFYIERGAVCSRINGYLTGTAPNGYPAHHTTLKSAVLGINDVDKLRALRKEIDEKKDYRISRKKIKRNGIKQKINKEIYFWSEEVCKYSMLFPFADSAVVSNSQGVSSALLHSQGIINKTFPQYAAYISFNSYWNVIQAISIGGLGKLLSNYEFGRNLLISYPSYLTLGVFSEDGPSIKQRETQTFSFKFYAKGYSKNLCSRHGYDYNKLNKLNCDYNISASVSGKDLGYSGTAKILCECAIVILQEENRINNGDLNKGFAKINGGIFTPSTVFGNTSLIKRLNEAGITFQIEDDDNDIFDEQKNDNDKDIGDDFEVINKPKQNNDLNQKLLNKQNNNNNDVEYDYDRFTNMPNDDDDDDDVPR